MSCILNISGENLNVNSLINLCELKPYKTFYKGDPKNKSRIKDNTFLSSGICIEASDSDFDDFKNQVTDTIQFLEENFKSLIQIQTFKGVDFAYLDFGIQLRQLGGVQVDTFPIKLIKLAAELGFELMFSIYAC